jgi:hypothetical protein
MNRSSLFQPLVTDDEEIEELARYKGIPTLVHQPALPAEPPPQLNDLGADNAAPSTLTGERPPDDAGELDTPRSRAKVAKPPIGKATPRNKLKTVNIELPDYTWTELKIRAANQQTTVKHVILKCLRANGITVREADMIPDGRRLRGKKYEDG